MPHGVWKRGHGHGAGRVLGRVGHPASWSGAGSQPDFLPRVHTGFSPPLRSTYYIGCFFNGGDAGGKRLHTIYPPTKRCFQPAGTWPIKSHDQLRRGSALCLSCWEMFPADMTPCSGQGAGDAHSMQRQGIPRWSCYALGTSPCTALPWLLPWAKHRGADPWSEGLPVCISRKLGVRLAGREGLFGSSYC